MVVCPVRLNRHSFDCLRPLRRSQSFLGTERRSIPLPIDQGLSLFGSVCRKIHRQAFAGLSWLSYSRPLDLPAVLGVSPLRFGLSPGSKLPTPGKLNEVCNPEPLAQDYAFSSSENTSPVLINDGLENISRYFRIALAQDNSRTSPILHRIELSDYSVSMQLAYKCQLRKSDYSTKPPSNRTSTSRCIRLYGPVA